MDEKKSRDDRARAWIGVVYPESAPDNWQDVLDSYHVQWAQSPLHDKDLNATGEPKKAHWHILFTFEGKKSFSQVKTIMDSVNAPIPQICHSAKGALRYMAHLDNPEKHQYSISDIVPHSGFDIQSILAPTVTESNEIVKQMCQFVKDNGIMEIQDLMDVAMEQYPDWWHVLCNSKMMVMCLYIRSQRERKTKPVCLDEEE